MGGTQVKPDINFPEHQQKFREVSKNVQNGPVQERQCQDVCCLVTYVILLALFLGIGVYYIARIDSGDFQRMSNAYANTTTSTSKTKHLIQAHRYFIDQQVSHEQFTYTSSSYASGFPNIVKAIPWIFLMSILAIVLSFVLVVAVSKAPKIVIYATLIFTTLLIIAGAVIGVVTGLIGLTITCLIFGLIWGILLIVLFCCLRQQLEAAIILLKVTGKFLQQKPAVLLAPIFAIIVSLFYFIFFLASLIGIQADRPFDEYKTVERRAPNGTMTTQIEYSFSIHDFFTIFWFFLNLFFTYFVYYCMVFLIAIATALWYYNIQGNYIVKGLKYIWNGHIGSFTFAALLVAIVSSLKNAANNNGQQQNACACICLCIVRCCLQFLEEIIKVLNHNAVIAMSVTGEGFIDSAKTAIYLIYNNFGLFVAIDMVQFLIKMSILFLVILLPTGLGVVLLKLTYDQATDSQDLYVIIGAVIIFIICLLIGMLITTVLSQALSCVFIFFCLDQKFRELNYGIINRVPGNLRSLFTEIQNQSRVVQADTFYRDSKQVNSYPQL